MISDYDRMRMILGNTIYTEALWAACDAIRTGKTLAKAIDDRGMTAYVTPDEIKKLLDAMQIIRNGRPHGRDT